MGGIPSRQWPHGRARRQSMLPLEHRHIEPLRRTIMSTVLRRLSHEMGVRFLMRRKATLTVAVLTLGLALAATTTAFSVLNTFLLSSIGVPDADRLMVVAPLRALPGRG